MSKTLNKNGKPRKIGSGKTKGAGCYADVTWAELKEVIGENTNIQVSRVWLKNIGLVEDKIQKDQISKEPKVKIQKISKDLPTPRITRINSKQKSPNLTVDHIDDDSYEPPPLFGTGEIKLNQY
mgnify:CR=1 FL=1|jgi:hypothetical protein|tara:strand:+ start:694 stop:1065 length:372 start_codon:yes stop_codon:yes gene_type:complete